MSTPEHAIPPCVLVLFGTGDLVRRKLMPSLFGMHRKGILPEGFSVLGFGRKDWDDAAYARQMREACDRFSEEPSTDSEWTSFGRRLAYVRGDFLDAQAYRSLAQRLPDLDRRWRTEGNRMFFLATLPSLYAGIAERLGAAGLVNRDTEGPFTRLMIEKPFGHDLTSAQTLNDALHRVFREEQIFRIDHYLGKETVQNLLVLRFANSVFETLWNRRHIDQVQITASETFGVENRGAYYEESGVLRDMVQNHLLQLLALIAMEPPLSFQADDVRDHKVEVLRALRPLSGKDALDNVVLGQYGPSADGVMPGYRQEPGVAPDSVTPTYAALRVFVDNWRWQGVPFYLRTGKRLARGCVEVMIQFKAVPHCLFGDAQACERIEPNRLVICLQPGESIQFHFGAKTPGTVLSVDPVRMHFGFRETHPDGTLSPYQRLVLGALRDDASLFARADGVEAAWRFVTPILEAFETSPPDDFPDYAAGSEGPLEAELLLRRDRQAWRPLSD
ncbi:MAG TPA: glucose-6-phosphate dehydrogenase [Thioalkalivibrio sp.]|nr:glucose-6-phosphate dehydrogenase [Thioalkalivibrio sp.]